MTYIGIAIFIVHTMNTVGIIGHVGKTEQIDLGIYHLVYVGEFHSAEACRKAAGAAKYTLKERERLDEMMEILCVPKTGDDARDEITRPAPRSSP